MSDDAVGRRRHGMLAQCFKTIDTCLASYYAGADHMYGPLAGQLRILLCDTDPLLSRVFPGLALSPLRPVQWDDPSDAPLFDGDPTRLAVGHAPGQEYRLARMPFLITKYANGLQVADLQLDPGAQLLPLANWMDQLVTLHPSDISLRKVVRSVANKDGGAHFDDHVGDALRAMYRTGPNGVGVDVLFVVAIARFAQKVGLSYVQMIDQFGPTGRLEDVVFDVEHSAVARRARVADDLEIGQRTLYAMTLVKRFR